MTLRSNDSAATGGRRRRGDSTTPRFLIALFLVHGLVALLVSCTDDGCVDPHPCEAQNIPYVVRITHFDYLEPALLDTTEMVFRFLTANGIPEDVHWGSTIGYIAPLRKRSAICHDSTGHCQHWEVEERAAWIAPTGDSLSKGLLTIDFPTLGSDSCHIKLSRFAGRIHAYGGRPVYVTRILSRPSGAAVVFDGKHTGKTTSATLHIAEWWNNHVVRLEMEGHKPDSLITPIVFGPTGIDSFMLFLEPLDPP